MGMIIVSVCLIISMVANVCQFMMFMSGYDDVVDDRIEELEMENHSLRIDISRYDNLESELSDSKYRESDLEIEIDSLKYELEQVRYELRDSENEVYRLQEDIEGWESSLD